MKKYDREAVRIAKMYGRKSPRFLAYVRKHKSVLSDSTLALHPVSAKGLEKSIADLNRQMPRGFRHSFMWRAMRSTRNQKLNVHKNTIQQYTSAVDYSDPQKVISNILPVYIKESNSEEKKSEFSEMLKNLMSEKGFTIDSLSEVSLVSKRVIERMRAPSDTRPSLEKVVAICIGMSLNPTEGRTLVEKAGYVFTDSKLDRLYNCFVDEAIRFDVKSANQVLIKYGYNTLV